VTVVVDDHGQILRTSEGRDLVSGGPYLKTTGGHNAIARPSVPFGMWGASSLSLIDGRAISFTEIFRTQPIVAAAINVFSRQISRLPLKVYSKNSQNERERVTKHPLVDLLGNPAPRCGATQLKQWIAQPILLHGNSTLLASRARPGQPPNRLWPLDWRYMWAHFDKGEPIRFWQTTEFGTVKHLDPEDVVHLRWEAPDGPIGISPLEQLGVTVRIERSAQEYQESYLRQGARPPSAITMPAVDGKAPGVILDKDLRKEMREDLEAAYAGSQNAGRPALLPGGFDWKTIAHTAHEAELIEQRKLSREEVASVYEVPQPLVGILDHATYSNVAELHRMLYTTVLGPWLTLIEESIKAQIIDTEPAFQGLFVEFDLAEVLKGDKVKEINALKIAVMSGLMTINEARAVLNLPAFPHQWCNEPLIPANNLASEPGRPGSAPSEEQMQAFESALERVLLAAK
jgi:HK97 family phage portal protein